MTAASALGSRRPALALAALWTLADGEPDAWDNVIDGALRGNAAAARAYVTSAKRLIRAVLLEAHETSPDVVLVADDSIFIVDAKRHGAVDALEVLELAILDAPLSPWTTEFGLGSGTALALLSRVRGAIPGRKPLPFPTDLMGGLPDLVSDSASFERFRLLVWEALRENAVSQLAELQIIFGLDNTETARLFGVTRQAVSDWLRRGVPADRAEKLVTMLQIGRMLESRLLPGLVPGIARKPAEAYGDRSMLELMAAGKHQALLDMTKRSFDWSSTA